MIDTATVIMETFNQVVGEPPPRGAKTTPADLDSWGSLVHVQLVFAIEQALGIRLPEEVLTSRTTVGALIEAAEEAAQAA